MNVKHIPWSGWRVMALVFLLSGLLLLLSGRAHAATFFSNDTRIPISEIIYGSCPGDEPIAVNGEMHLLTAVTLDGNGGWHGIFHWNTQGLSGTGLTSGAKYQYINAGNLSEHYGSVGYEYTEAGMFQVVGQGPDTNEVFYVLVHATVNANGTVTANVYNVYMTCTPSGGIG